MPDLELIASGLRFPEGPIAMPDGSIVLVEIARGTLSRVDPATGAIDVVAECGGGPNGAAIGPDGKAYVCNNGGCFEWVDLGGMLFPGSPPPASWPGHGSIQRVDLATGEVEELFAECDGHPLRAPQDIVFDAGGVFWSTAQGGGEERSPDRPPIYAPRHDGSSITELALGLEG